MLAQPHVWHIRNAPKDAVYCGRPGPWGNPYVMGPHGTRAEVIAKYRIWLFDQPLLVGRVKKELRGKHLSCWCAPLPCHAEILLELANE